MGERLRAFKIRKEGKKRSIILQMVIFIPFIMLGLQLPKMKADYCTSDSGLLATVKFI